MTQRFAFGARSESTRTRCRPRLATVCMVCLPAGPPIRRCISGNGNGPKWGWAEKCHGGPPTEPVARPGLRRRVRHVLYAVHDALEAHTACVACVAIVRCACESLRPAPRRGSAHPSHICARTGLAPAAYSPGLNEYCLPSCESASSLCSLAAEAWHGNSVGRKAAPVVVEAPRLQSNLFKYFTQASPANAIAVDASAAAAKQR